MIDLKGHTALVTGSSQGVGHGIAVTIARAGGNVLIHGRQESDASKQAVADCKAHGVEAGFVPGDLSLDPTEQVTDALFQAAIAAMPGVDLLVNNAGQYFDLPYLDMTPERLGKTLRLNVQAPYLLTQRFARHWIENRVDGRVLMIGSINGQLAEPDSTAYDTSKGALAMMVKTLAVALAPRGIRVNGMAPGLVRTPQTGWLIDNQEKANWIKHHTPNHQIPDNIVCGPGAVYLLSDDAAHVHGQMLMIDGGMSAWQHPEPPRNQ